MMKDQFIAALPVSAEDVTVRLFSAEDISEAYIGWLNHPGTMRFSNQRFIQHDDASCQAFYHSVKASPSVFLAIEHKAFGHVGTMTVHFNDRHGTADMGILVGAPDVKGLGVGRRAWQLALDLALSLPEMRKVTAGTLSCNRAMLGVADATGMVPDGIRIAQELVDGEAYDMHYFAAFR